MQRTLHGNEKRPELRDGFRKTSTESEDRGGSDTREGGAGRCLRSALSNFSKVSNWPTQVRELILDSESGSQGVKGKAERRPGDQGVGLQDPRGSRGRHPMFLGSRGRLGLLGPRVARGRPTGSQGVKG